MKHHSPFPVPRSLIPHSSHRAFTLIELLVVIAIIGVLAGVLMTSFSGGTETARAAQCLSNMRNLAAACQTYGATSHRYPLAGSIEYMTIDESDGIARAKGLYRETPGWISWASMNAYLHKPSSHQASSNWMIPFYASNDADEKSLYALTNGVLWKYVSGNRNTYICPNHRKKASKGLTINWSYVMNAYFGWDTSEGGEAQSSNFSHIEYGQLNRADRILLFGELPFGTLKDKTNKSETLSGKEADCVLQFDTSATAYHGDLGAATGGDGREYIGFNHTSGRSTYANVVFADGHTEKLQLPSNGSDEGTLRELTTWLCMGEDVIYDGKRYTRRQD